jgi:ppGpp synthetase/RelA/SpoT-type nucleotidyltranferase
MQVPKKQTDKTLEGAQLLLRCRDIHDISVKVSDLVVDELKKAAATEHVYTFKHRLKKAQNIYDKVIRKRAEGKERAGIDPPDIIQKLSTYNPDHVTDAWGCRYVTLFQNQIPRVVEAVLNAAEVLNKSPGITDLTLVEFVFYTNRPLGDPLSIEKEVRQIFAGTTIRSIVDKKTIIRDPENKKSAYSSVHLVFQLQVNVDLLDRRQSAEDGKFEVQIRDIFEEGWGEIQHQLLYSQKDGFERLPVTDEALAPWKPHLNALKTFVDGCSQHASIIQKNFEYSRARPAPSPWISVSSREDDRKDIVAKMKASNAVDLVVPTDLAYELLIDASKEQAADLAAQTYLAAALKFEEVVAQLGPPLVFDTVPHRHGRTVEYFVKIELANCYLMAQARVERSQLLRAKNLYIEMAGRFDQDATVRFRLAQVMEKLLQNPEEPEEAIATLNACVDLVGQDVLLNPYHWMQLSARSMLGRLYWRLSKSYVLPDQAQKKIDALDLAINTTREAVNLWEREPDKYKHSDEHKLFAHKASSNILYYLSKLKPLGDLRKDALEDGIRQFKSISPPAYDELYRSQDNLMHGYYALGRTDEARSCAYDNYNELVSRAEQRASRRLPAEEVERYLTPAEVPSYSSALRIITKQGLDDEP